MTDNSNDYGPSQEITDDPSNPTQPPNQMEQPKHRQMQQPIATVCCPNNFIRPPQPLQVAGDNCANTWQLWIQQYHWFEVATDMHRKPHDVRVATLLSSIGTEAVVLFNSFGCTDAELADIDAVKRRFRQHFAPKTNVTYERYVFNSMVQDAGECFDVFLARIRQQSSRCAFETLHDSLLRDRIVVGIRNSAVRQQLLSDEEQLSLDQVAQRCRGIELAEQVATAKSNDRREPAIILSDQFDCSRCGGTHGKRECSAYRRTCSKCNRKGHFAAMCREGEQVPIRKCGRRQNIRHDCAETNGDGEPRAIETTNEVRNKLHQRTCKSCSSTGLIKRLQTISSEIHAEVDNMVRRNCIRPRTRNELEQTTSVVIDGIEAIGHTLTKNKSQFNVSQPVHRCQSAKNGVTLQVEACSVEFACDRSDRSPAGRNSRPRGVRQLRGRLRVPTSDTSGRKVCRC